MSTRNECMRHVGRYVRFKTPYGMHEGIIERVEGNKAMILSPQQFIPVELASEPLGEDEVKRLNLDLAFGGGYGAPGYGARPGMGAGAYGAAPYGAGPGYGYGYGWGWGRWAVSFLVIYVLWGLFFW